MRNRRECRVQSPGDMLISHCSPKPLCNLSSPNALGRVGRDVIADAGEPHWLPVRTGFPQPPACRLPSLISTSFFHCEIRHAESLGKGKEDLQALCHLAFI